MFAARVQNICKKLHVCYISRTIHWSFGHSSGVNRAYNKTATGAFKWHYKIFMLGQNLTQNTNEKAYNTYGPDGPCHFHNDFKTASLNCSVACTHRSKPLSAQLGLQQLMSKVRHSKHKHGKLPTYTNKSCLWLQSFIFNRWKHITLKLLTAETR